MSILRPIVSSNATHLVRSASRDDAAIHVVATERRPTRPGGFFLVTSAAEGATAVTPSGASRG